MASASERKVGVVFLLCTLLMTSPLHSSGFIGVLIAIGAEKLGEVIVIAVVAEEAAAATAATAAAAALAAEEAAARAAAAADAALQEKLEELSESTIIGVKAEVDATLHSVVADVAATDAVARFMFSARELCPPGGGRRLLQPGCFTDREWQNILRSIANLRNFQNNAPALDDVSEVARTSWPNSVRAVSTILVHSSRIGRSNIKLACQFVSSVTTN